MGYEDEKLHGQIAAIGAVGSAIGAGILAHKNKKKKYGKNDLFEQLRQVRLELASEQAVPPYIVFNDKTLHEMCLFLPQNKEQFLMINGVGQSKHEKYGKVFMDKIAEFI